MEQLRHNNLFGVETGLLVDRCVFEWRRRERFRGWPVVESPLMTSSSSLVKFPIEMSTRLVVRGALCIGEGTVGTFCDITGSEETVMEVELYVVGR